MEFCGLTLAYHMTGEERFLEGKRELMELHECDERDCDRWSTDQYRLDRGMDGRVGMDGADILAPYWMGRCYGFIRPQ